MLSPEVWLPYAPELREVFRYDPATEPDVSEWFTTEESFKLIPYLEADRRYREAEERAAEDQEKAAQDMREAKEDRQRLDGGEVGKIRRRAEKRLAYLSQGRELPSRLKLKP